MPGFAGGTPPPSPMLVERGLRLDASFLPVLVRPSAEETRDSKILTAAVEALRSGGYRRACILLEDYRRHSVGSLGIRCLHAWALALAGELDVARNMATALVAGEDPAAPGPAYLMGVVLDEQGRRADAFAWYQLALRASPSDADLLKRTAQTGSAARAPEFVLECLEKLDRRGGLPLELEPLRARALAQAGRGEAALLTYDLLLGQLGEKPDFLAEAGLCAFGLGNERNDPSFFDLAADYFSRSVEVDPQNARASYNLGCALDWGGDSSGAELSYARALEVRPDYLEAAENLSELLVRNDRPGEAREILNEQLRQPLPETSRSRLLARLALLEEPRAIEG
jgi:tetratricopeptide (TPR) repeat protein